MMAIGLGMRFLFAPPVESVQWTFDKTTPDDINGELQHLAEFLANKQFDLVINLPMSGGGAR
ncbi:hypothetical protein KR009_001003, partial [Drosophila setifemur]